MDFEIFDFWRFLPVADKERLAVLVHPVAHIDDLFRACLMGKPLMIRGRASTSSLVPPTVIRK